MSQTAGGGDWRGLALATTAVAELVGPPLLGYWADNRFGSAPWGLAAGAVLGFGGGLAHLVITSRRADKQADTPTDG